MVAVGLAVHDSVLAVSWPGCGGCRPPARCMPSCQPITVARAKLQTCSEDSRSQRARPRSGSCFGFNLIQSTQHELPTLSETAVAPATQYNFSCQHGRKYRASKSADAERGHNWADAAVTAGRTAVLPTLPAQCKEARLTHPFHIPGVAPAGSPLHSYAALFLTPDTRGKALSVWSTPAHDVQAVGASVYECNRLTFCR